MANTKTEKNHLLLFIQEFLAFHCEDNLITIIIIIDATANIIIIDCDIIVKIVIDFLKFL